MSLSQMVVGAKDAAVSMTVQAAANRNLDFGRVRSLKLDSQARRIEVELDLHGESEVVHVVIEDYRLGESPEGLTITAGKITTSRQWLTVLAQRFVVGRPWPLPMQPAAQLLVTRLI